MNFKKNELFFYFIFTCVILDLLKWFRSAFYSALTDFKITLSRITASRITVLIFLFFTPSWNPTKYNIGKNAFYSVCLCLSVGFDWHLWVEKNYTWKLLRTRCKKHMEEILSSMFYRNMSKANLTKQPTEVFFKKRCSEKFCKIHKKTPVPEPY